MTSEIALGAESFSDVEKVLKEKVEEAVKRTNNNRDRQYLIRWVMVSAEMQGLIKAWRNYEYEDKLVYEIQISFPIFPRIFISVPLVEK